MRHRRQFQRIGVDEAQRVVRRDDVLVLDVRDAVSFGNAHVKGAQHLSTANLSEVIDGTARGRPVLIYCYHGNASREYARIFADFGFSEVYSLDGGYEAWSNQPRAKDDGVLDQTLRQWLTEQGFSPDERDAVIANGTTPLMKASHQGQGPVVRMLIAAGARLNARNADGNNALWLASVGDHLDVIDILVEAGIDVDNRNDNGATPLMYAASSGKAGIVERLLVTGADPSPETLDGFTALDLASTTECLALLRRVGVAGSKARPSKARLEAAPAPNSFRHRSEFQ
jgi:rhodanese-related sulfurtransferase